MILQNVCNMFKTIRRQLALLFPLICLFDFVLCFEIRTGLVKFGFSCFERSSLGTELEVMN